MTFPGGPLLRRRRGLPPIVLAPIAVETPEPVLSTIGQRGRKKFIVRLALAAIVGVMALGVLVGSAGIIAAITQSEETTEVFTEAAELPPDLIEAVTWLPDADDLPRQMEPLTRVDVTASWLRGWEQLSIVAETGDTSGVEVYFSNSARQGVLAQAENWEGRSLEQLGHDLALTFYSEDGQVIGLTAVETRLKRTQQVGDYDLIRYTVEQYEAVLVLEDGNWRIQHWVRRSIDDGRWILEPMRKATPPAVEAQPAR